MNSIYLRETPFVRLLLFFVMGLLLAVVVPITAELSLIAVLLVIGAIIIVIINSAALFNQLRFFRLKNATISMWWLILGFYSWQAAYPLLDSSQFSKHQVVALRISITEINKVKPTHIQAQAKVLSGVDSLGNTLSLSGKMAVFIKTDSNVTLKYGQDILIPANYNEVKPPDNPHEFNYKRYLYYKHIVHQAFLYPNQYLVLPTNSGNALFKWAYALRDYFVLLYAQYIPDVDAQNLLVALVLGYRSDLSKEIVSAFTDTGTTHVLSVSGLHVGIIYYVLNVFLGFFAQRIPNGAIIKAALIFTLIWVYALLTGLSPCICRAAVMISFIVIGKAGNKQINTYNLIACSALLLLLIDPFLLTDVGFQLSYLALTGIIYLQPKIYNWFLPEKYITKQIWMLCSVSLAAQVATLPVTLYYFHQFPNYFLLANLVVIPLSTILLYGGVLLLLVAPLSGLAQATGWMLTKVVWAMNASLHLLQELPYTTITGIYLSSFDLLFLCNLVALLISYCIVPRAVLLRCILFIGCVWSIGAIGQYYNSYNQRTLTFYKIGRETIIGVKQQDSLWLFANDRVDTALLYKKIAPDMQHNGIVHSVIVSLKGRYASTTLFTQKGLLQVGAATILVPRKEMVYKEQLVVDYVLVDTLLNINSIKTHVAPTTIVASATLPSHFVRQLEEWAQTSKAAFYNLKTQPALQQNF